MFSCEELILHQKLILLEIKIYSLRLDNIFYL